MQHRNCVSMYHSRALPERHRRWGWKPEGQQTCRPANWPKADHHMRQKSERPRVGWKTIFNPVSLHQLILLYGRYACIDHNWYGWPTRSITVQCGVWGIHAKLRQISSQMSLQPLPKKIQG